MAGEQEKLGEMVLYLAQRMQRENHTTPSRIKLAKLLFFIDFEAYARFGRSVSATTYHADRLGPAPTAELTTTRDLEADGRLRWENPWERMLVPVAVGDPVLNAFEPRERELMDEFLGRYRFTAAQQMVDEAHRFPGWIHAWRDGEGSGSPVPYTSIFWNHRRTTSEPWEDERARALAGRAAALKRAG